MKRRLLLVSGIVAVLLTVLVVGVPVAAKGFTHGILVDVDGEGYYLAGAPAGPPPATDVPGHEWVQAGMDQLVGKHYNTGPGPFAVQGWSSDAPDGELLYVVHGIIDEWTLEKAESYYSRGYVHYHELVAADNGELHPAKVLWLKHTARTTFTLDRGPAYWGGNPSPPYTHSVTPGIDYQFPNNSFEPYEP